MRKKMKKKQEKSMRKCRTRGFFRIEKKLRM